MSQLKPPQHLIDQLGDANVTPNRQRNINLVQCNAEIADYDMAELIADITPVVLRLPKGQCEQWCEYAYDVLYKLSHNLMDEYDDGYDEDEQQQIIADYFGAILEEFYLQIVDVLQQLESSFHKQLKQNNTPKTWRKIAADPRFPLWLKLLRFYFKNYRGSSRDICYYVEERLEHAEAIQQSLKKMAHPAQSAAQPTTKRNKPKRKKSQPT